MKSHNTEVDSTYTVVYIKGADFAELVVLKDPWALVGAPLPVGKVLPLPNTSGRNVGRANGLSVGANVGIDVGVTVGLPGVRVGLLVGACVVGT